MDKFIRDFKAAKRVSTPLIAVQTPDPADTMRRITAQCTALSNDAFCPVIGWDIARGFWSLPQNKPGQSALASLVGNRGPETFRNIAEALLTLSKQSDGRLILPADSIVYVLQAHRYMQDPVVTQALWNIRDLFKQDGQTLVLLCPQVKLKS